MKKIVILLIAISGLFGSWKYQTNPTTIRQLYVLDENHIKHYSDGLEWRTEHQVLLIHDVQQVMRKIRKGEYNQKKSQEMTDIIQRYVDLEKFHREELKAIRLELRKVSK